MARKPRPAPATPQPPAEDLTAEALTIGWLLAVLTTLLCEIGAVIAFWLGAQRVPVMGGLLLFSALVIGLCSIGLGELVRRYRRVPAPRGVTVFALMVGLLPIVAAIINAFR